MTNLAISVSNLTKIFTPNTKAVSNLNLNVKEGEVMALLGPNGAGKSTTIRILSTLSGFDEGEVHIGGMDIDRNPEAVRQTIGVVAQQTGVEYFMTGRENMMVQGRLYKMKKADILERIDELAHYFELDKSIDRLVMTYSGGMRRKLDIATALIHRPKILYLDEPTLGLDIHSRKLLWKYIDELNKKFGLTILLTTHYLEEADSLSHRVAIINEGTIQIVGTSDELKNSIHGDSVVISFDEVSDSEKAYAETLKQKGLVSDILWDSNNLHLYVESGASSVPPIMEQAAKSNVHVKTLSLARPTLDDVFLKYTGTSMLDTGEEEAEEWWEQWGGNKKGWKGNKWVNEDGTPKGEWEDTEEWQGNEWVNPDGSPKETAPQEDADDASQSTSDSGTDKAWSGNEWVDKEGKQQGDWGDAPDWKGNEWVDKEGKPKQDWQGTEQQTVETQPDNATEEDNAKDPDWQGNEWVEKDGKQQGDWGDSSDWQGNEWVDADGKPKGNWKK
jgi:ABC-2 type transport system ATP-binding protein